MCDPNKHRIRDNKFGVTWCTKCGRLFTKPCGVLLNNSRYEQHTKRLNKTSNESID